MEAGEELFDNEADPLMFSELQKSFAVNYPKAEDKSPTSKSSMKMFLLFNFISTCSSLISFSIL